LTIISAQLLKTKDVSYLADQPNNVFKNQLSNYQNNGYINLKIFYLSTKLTVKKANYAYINGNNYFIAITGNDANNNTKILQFTVAPISYLQNQNALFGDKEENYQWHRQIEYAKGFTIDENDNTVNNNQSSAELIQKEEGLGGLTLEEYKKQHPLPERETFEQFLKNTLPSLIGTGGSASPNGVGGSVGDATHIDPLTYTRPATISVKMHATGDVVAVDFYKYICDVLPNEWDSGTTTKAEALKSGAMMIKCYAWHRHYDAMRTNFDVYDDTRDQVYIPNSSNYTTDIYAQAVNGVGNIVACDSNKKLFVMYYTQGYSDDRWANFGHGSQSGSDYLAGGGLGSDGAKHTGWFNIVTYYFSYFTTTNNPFVSSGTCDGSSAALTQVSY